MKPADICTSWILLFYENVISGWVGISVFLNDRKNTDCCIILKLTGNAKEMDQNIYKRALSGLKRTKTAA